MDEQGRLRAPTAAAAPGDAVARWIDHHAQPLWSLDPEAPLIDLRPLAPRLGRATVVGLGATAGAHEPFLLRHRLARLLVEQLGFRAIALEEDWTKGIELDRWIRADGDGSDDDGAGDLRALLVDAGLPWQVEEIVDLLRWMRSFNRRHPGDPVRLVGADVVAVRAAAYDAVTAHVARVAPDRSAELAGHYGPLRPSGPIGAHIGRLRAQADRRPFVDHARAAFDLVDGLPARRPGHDLAVQHARVVLGFHEHHAASEVGVRDRCLADTTSWWHAHTGAKVVFWAGNVHTAVADPLVVHRGDLPPASQVSAGAHLRARHGRAYRSVGVTFHHGAVNAGIPTAPRPVPDPAPDFLEATLGGFGRGRGSYLLDLDVPQPGPVRAWLAPPLRAYAIGPSYDAAHPTDDAMSGPTPDTWFDVILHTPTATPTHVLR